MISLFPHFDGKWLLTASHLWDKWHYQLLIWYFFGGQSAFHHLWQKWSIFSGLSSLPIPLYWHPMTAATYFGVFNWLMFNYSTQETLFSETSVVIWLKRSTSRFLENHTVPVRSICAKQTNISFFLFSVQKQSSASWDLCRVYHPSLLSRLWYDVANNPPRLISVLISSHIHSPFEQSSKDNEILCRSDWKQPSSCEISRTYVIPVFKQAVWKMAVIRLKWIDSPVSYCQCASGKRVFLISPEENASPPQQFF